MRWSLSRARADGAIAELVAQKVERLAWGDDARFLRRKLEMHLSEPLLELLVAKLGLGAAIARDGKVIAVAHQCPAAPQAAPVELAQIQIGQRPR